MSMVQVRNVQGSAACVGRPAAVTVRHAMVGKSTSGSGGISAVSVGRRHGQRRHGPSRLSTTRGALEIAQASSSVEVNNNNSDEDGNEIKTGTPKTEEEITVEEKLKAIGFVKYEFDPEEREQLDKMAREQLGFGYAEFDRAIAETYKEDPHVGERVKGRILSFDAKGMYVDIGAIASGYCPASEISMGPLGKPSEVFRRGETRDFIILEDARKSGHIKVSCKEEETAIAWARIRQLQAEDVAVEGVIAEVNRGGILIDFENMSGFVPGSHLSAEFSGATDEVVGQTMLVKFLEVDEERDRLVLSNRRASAEANLSGHKVGDVVAGVISAIKPFGAFVDIGGVNGLLHISQISHDRITSVENLLSVGDELKVMIIAQDRERGRVSLSTKKLEPNPGDMLRNPQLVYEKAEEIAATFRERVAAAEAAARVEEDMLAAQARAALLGEDASDATATADESSRSGQD